MNRIDPVSESFIAYELTLSSIINTCIIYITFFVQLLSIFYFAITLSSSSIKNIRLGKAFWIIIGLPLEILNIMCINHISKFSIGLKFFNFNRVLLGLTQAIGGGSFGNYLVVGYNYKLYIPTLVYIVVTTIILFYITSKLIDNKVEVY